jgi:ubiquinone/menaquinone biosynthesis C-methylase UbiE
MQILNLLKRGKDRNVLWKGHDPMAKARFIANKIRKFIPCDARHLDIACGDGDIMQAFADIGCKSVGIELLQYRVERCHKRRLNVVKGDITKGLPFEKDSFNVVTLISILEHLQDTKQLMSEVERILSPGGIAVIQIPNPFFPIDLHYFLPFYGYLPEFVREPYRRIFAGDKYGINYYTAQTTRKEVEALTNNFEELHAEGFTYPVEVAPDWLKPLYELYSQTIVVRIFPTGYLFVRKKAMPIDKANANAEKIGKDVEIEHYSKQV